MRAITYKPKAESGDTLMKALFLNCRRICIKMADEPPVLRKLQQKDALSIEAELGCRD